jgi:hypothetical protein
MGSSRSVKVAMNASSLVFPRNEHDGRAASAQGDAINHFAGRLSVAGEFKR